ncbi:MAG: DUF4445 domain-containing protein [Dehalococcoidales bacterium]|nr:MAG: DUF4445 domain-containing protein [Dehalococcoidales bacterium]
MSKHTVVFEPIGRKGECGDKESILDCARGLGIGISSICAGRGTCGTCRVQLTEGTLSKPSDSELAKFSKKELNNGWRLACQASPMSDCQVIIPPEGLSSSERIYLDGMETPVALEPPVKSYTITMTAPTLTDQEADAERVLSALKAQHKVTCSRVENAVLRSISPNLRKLEWECQVAVRGEEVVAIMRPDSPLLGMAIDLGTTTVAGYLVDMTTGKTLASDGVMNPQIGYGEDVISRIDFAVRKSADAKKLQKLVVNRFNDLAKELCAKAKTDMKSIVEVVVVGNTAMHHLLLNLPVRQLVLSPFTAAVSMPVDVKAYELGMKIATGAYVHFPPVVTGFVGADHVAMLQAIDNRDDGKVIVALDIGTNTEISLMKGDKITSTSCASGPAFEGGHIKQGMRAAKGAIERVRINDGKVSYQTIGEAPPIGICGSGVLDALAQMYLAGVIDESGRFATEYPGIRREDGKTEFVLAEREDDNGEKEAIVINQKDVRELQLAKAAIRSGIQLLLERNGFTDKNIDSVIVAGAFGTYIDLESSMNVGLLPSLPVECFKQVGNAAGIGAKMNLISLSSRKEARDIVSRATYIELAGTKEFKRDFVQSSFLGRYRLNEGKREVVD